MRGGASDADLGDVRPKRGRPKPRRGAFKPFDRTWWPASTRWPYARLVLALLMAPAPWAAALGGLTWSLYQRNEVDAARAADMAWETAEMALVGFTAMSVVGGAMTLPYLWTTRRRSAWPWILAGLFVGAAAAWIGAFLENSRAGAVPIIALAVFGALLFLTIRLIAGIRSTS